MDQKYAVYIFAGALVGALLGLLWRSEGSGFVGIWVGVLVGAAVGWFYAAYRSQGGGKPGKQG